MDRSLRNPPPAPRWSLLTDRLREQHVTFLARYLALFALAVTGFSVLFHVAMALEGREHAWWVGPYWTVSTMTTLGLGDVVFGAWPGQVLSTLVVLTGLVFMLVLLPLVLTRFPAWIEAQGAARVRRALPREVRGHVVLTHRDPVTEHLVRRLQRHGARYVLIVADPDEAVRLADHGWSVLQGEPDAPETYRAARLEQAGLLAATDSDVKNSNAVFTARGVAPEVPILSTADQPISVEVLQLAGSTRVLQLTARLARGLARRVSGGDALAHVVGRFDELLIAEANASRTPLVGRKLRESHLRELIDAEVIGVWDRGEFQVAGPETEIGPHTVLVLAGTREELASYDAVFAIYNVSAHPVLVIGGGRVGRATAGALAARGIDYRIVERDAARCADEHYVPGDGSDPSVLERAGIARAPAIVITTHDDDMNVFLALYCRRLRPDVQIVSRATAERSVETLHRAGTDFVLSIASIGADAIFNLLAGGDTLTLSEGLNLFQVALPAKLAGRSLAEVDLRRETGCTVVALRTAEGVRTRLDPREPLPAGAEAILIGAREAEARFFERYGD